MWWLFNSVCFSLPAADPSQCSRQTDRCKDHTHGAANDRKSLEMVSGFVKCKPTTYKDVLDKVCCVVDKGSNQDLDREKGVWLTFKWTSGFWLWRPVGRRRHSGRIP